MNLETKITIYKFTPQLFTLTRYNRYLRVLFYDRVTDCGKSIAV